jgi:uncharacterized protein YgiM (DUF1202 family)
MSTKTTLIKVTAAALIAVGASVAAARQAAADGVITATVNTAGLNLRTAPGPDALVETVLRRDTTVTVLGRDFYSDAGGNIWIKVRTVKGTTGWVDSFFTTLNGASAIDLPIIDKDGNF